jgi:hypothetical protein
MAASLTRTTLANGACRTEGLQWSEPMEESEPRHYGSPAHRCATRSCKRFHVKSRGIGTGSVGGMGNHRRAARDTPCCSRHRKSLCRRASNDDAPTGVASGVPILSHLKTLGGVHKARLCERFGVLQSKMIHTISYLAQCMQSMAWFCAPAYREYCAPFYSEASLRELYTAETCNMTA